MGLRDRLNEHSTAATLGVIALLVVALSTVVFVMRGPGTPTAGDHHYVDLTTGQRFVAPAGTQRSEAGNPAARAYVFSCTSCGDPDEQFVGYVIQSPPPAGIAGHIAVSRDLEHWVGVEDPRYSQIMNIRCEDGSVPRECPP